VTIVEGFHVSLRLDRQGYVDLGAYLTMDAENSEPSVGTRTGLPHSSTDGRTKPAGCPWAA